jgi:hypothetical protein
VGFAVQIVGRRWLRQVSVERCSNAQILNEMIGHYSEDGFPAPRPNR